MKKFNTVFIAFVIVFLFSSSFFVSAQYSGGGGSFGAPKEEQEQHEEPMTEEDMSEMVMQLLQILIFGGTPITAYIIYEQKLSKSARASKRIMNMLDQKDSVWKFKNIMPRFEKIFDAIKNARIQDNFDLAEQFVTQEMLDKLKMQRTWAEKLNKYCYPSRIKLHDARPVAVFDCYDDECDHIWFYVEWSALESRGQYGSLKQLKGNKEFWQLKRCNNEWRLCDIVDKETGDKLIFGDEAIVNVEENSNN